MKSDGFEYCEVAESSDQMEDAFMEISEGFDWSGAAAVPVSDSDTDDRKLASIFNEGTFDSHRDAGELGPSPQIDLPLSIDYSLVQNPTTKLHHEASTDEAAENSSAEEQFWEYLLQPDAHDKLSPNLPDDLSTTTDSEREDDRKSPASGEAGASDHFPCLVNPSPQLEDHCSGSEEAYQSSPVSQVSREASLENYGLDVVDPAYSFDRSPELTTPPTAAFAIAKTHDFFVAQQECPYDVKAVTSSSDSVSAPNLHPDVLGNSDALPTLRFDKPPPRDIKWREINQETSRLATEKARMPKPVDSVKKRAVKKSSKSSKYAPPQKVDFDSLQPYGPTKEEISAAGNQRKLTALHSWYSQLNHLKTFIDKSGNSDAPQKTKLGRCVQLLLAGISI